MLNLYRGTIAFDANGEAIVTLPDYFDAVNTDFSYQLTPVGGYAPIFIKEKIANGQFVIGGGNPTMEVSWTVCAQMTHICNNIQHRNKLKLIKKNGIKENTYNQIYTINPRI